MRVKWIVGLVLMIGLIIPAAAWAHGGHTHKVMGTLSAVDGSRVDVKATDGKVVTVMLDQKTTITRGKAKLDAAALKVGERVSIDYMQEKDGNMAKAVKLATATATARK
jgi:hypothetical protein